MKTWIYETNKNNSARFILGESGKKNLLWIGVNPSTAEANKLDNTTKAVQRLSNRHGYDGWAIVNLYPIRSTDPNNLPLRSRRALHESNLRFIDRFLSEVPGPICAAWGNLIDKRSYLKRYLHDICVLPNMQNLIWYHIGSITKRGNPRHPLYIPSTADLHVFDTSLYLAKNHV